MVYVLFQRFLGEVWVLAQLSHPNVIRFLGINPSPNHPFALVLDTGGNLGLVEYLRKYPEADKLKLVRHLPFDVQMRPS